MRPSLLCAQVGSQLLTRCLEGGAADAAVAEAAVHMHVSVCGRERLCAVHASLQAWAAGWSYFTTAVCLSEQLHAACVGAQRHGQLVAHMHKSWYVCVQAVLVRCRPGVSHGLQIAVLA